jgi:hypothetical protein
MEFVYLSRNNTGMKKKLIFVVVFVIMAASFGSCTQNCKFCKTVTYENGNVINETAETEYCGANLITKEATPDITVGNLVTKVECR